MAKEYIDREAALMVFEKVCDICMALVAKPMCEDCSIADTVRKVKSIPAADVVEVKRAIPTRHYQRFLNSDGEIVREVADGWECPICREAANAIEELEEKCQALAETLYAYEHPWIPVTERLPESGVHVLAACRVKYVGGGGRSYVCDAFYSEHFKEQRSTEYDDIELDYDEETDEYYLPEGWWEVIRNWDEYGFVGIEDFVTHWMPLPEPPKMENEK